VALRWYVFWAFAIVGSVVFGAAILALYQERSWLVISVDNPFDLASLLLASASLVVTFLGVGVALLALWGFQAIKIAAIDAAREAATEEARSVAQSVASRTAIEAVQATITTPPPEQADEIARATPPG